MPEPTDAPILPFRRPDAASELTADQQRLIDLAVEGEYLERTVVDFSGRAYKGLEHLKRHQADRDWGLPLIAVLRSIGAAVNAAIEDERRP